MAAGTLELNTAKSRKNELFNCDLYLFILYFAFFVVILAQSYPQTTIYTTLTEMHKH